MDGSAVNMQLLSMYADTDLGAAETADSAIGCSITNTWSGRPLYLILDPVHAFKNQRNSIASSGLGSSSGRGSSASSAGGGAADGFAADSTVCGSGFASAPGSAGGGPGIALGGSGGGGWPGGTLGGSGFGFASAPGSAGAGSGGEPGIAPGGWPGGTLGGSGFANAPGSAEAGSGGGPGIAPGGRKRGPPPTTAGVPGASVPGAAGHKYIRTLWRRGHWIGWPHWLALYHSQLHAGTEQIALAHKLTTDHLYLRGFLKMNVRLAAQACSGRVAFGLQQAAERRAAERGACDAEEFCRCPLQSAELCRVLNEVFDIFNSSGSYGRALQGLADPRLDRLAELCHFLTDGWAQEVTEFAERQSISMQDAKSMMPAVVTRKQLKISLHGVIGFSKYWMREFSAEAEMGVFLRVLQQDALEHFFGQMRARGGTHRNPDMLSVRWRVQAIFMAAECDEVLKANVRFKPTALQPPLAIK